MSSVFNMHPIESSIYVSTWQNSYSLADLNLSSGIRFKFSFNIQAKQIIYDSDAEENVSIIHYSSDDFSHQLDDRLLNSDEEREGVVKDMLFGIQIPFSLDVVNFIWISGGEQEPLHNGVNDVVTKISELVACTAADTALSGCNRAKMIIWIESHSTVPHDEFVRLASRYSSFVPYVIDDDDGDDNDDDDGAFNSVVEQSLLESGSVVKAADESALEGLERLRYEGSSGNGDDESKELFTCVICVEEAMIGSPLIRMPCSHMFHEDCILKWLKNTNTCPLCRFSLPSG